MLQKRVNPSLKICGNRLDNSWQRDLNIGCVVNETIFKACPMSKVKIPGLQGNSINVQFSSKCTWGIPYGSLRWLQAVRRPTCIYPQLISKFSFYALPTLSVFPHIFSWFLVQGLPPLGASKSNLKIPILYSEALTLLFSTYSIQTSPWPCLFSLFYD